jgi:hypothetical protein
MVIENQIPKTETVYEIKNEILSYEEFMKGYESDGSLNYDELNSWNIGTPKVYGPGVSSVNVKKLCGKCGANKEVSASAAYCPTCGTAFGVVVKSQDANLQNYADKALDNVRKQGGKFRYTVEKRTNPDGSYVEREYVDYDNND